MLTVSLLPTQADVSLASSPHTFVYLLYLKTSQVTLNHPISTHYAAHLQLSPNHKSFEWESVAKVQFLGRFLSNQSLTSQADSYST